MERIEVSWKEYRRADSPSDRYLVPGPPNGGIEVFVIAEKGSDRWRVWERYQYKERWHEVPLSDELLAKIQQMLDSLEDPGEP